MWLIMTQANITETSWVVRGASCRVLSNRARSVIQWMMIICEWRRQLQHNLGFLISDPLLVGLSSVASVSVLGGRRNGRFDIVEVGWWRT